MKALQILKPREFQIVDIPRPEPTEGEVVVKLEYAAICNQNDYKIFYGLYGDLIEYPCDPGVFGHEGVGTVVEVGPGVDSLAEGDRVVMMGEGGPMLYMEYVLREAGSVAPVAPAVPPEEAAVLELFGCGYHCLEIVGDVRGRKVAVSGLGPAGLAISQMLMLKGPSRAVGIEPSADRAAIGRELGLAEVYDPTTDEGMKALLEEKIDTVIDATGVPEAILNAMEITTKEVVIFGFTNKPFEVDQSKWFQKELVIKNSKVQTVDDLRAAVKLLEKGRIRTREFISGVMTFDEYAEAVEKVYKKEAVKILLTWEKPDA